jgi:hypothetical protein
MKKEIQEELEMGIIKLMEKQSVRLVLRTFLRRKKDKSFRKILDCTPLNEFIKSKKFKMQDARTVIQTLRPGMWACSIDIKKAFHHVNVSESLLPYLCSEYRGLYYTYVSMPFGIKSAPLTFTKIMHHCLGVARRHWEVHIIQYIDDILLLHHDKEYLQRSVGEIVQFLQKLGWLLNFQKSALEPSQCFTYLGFTWDTATMTLRVEPDKSNDLLRSTRTWYRRVIRGQRVPVRALASFIGRLSQTRLQHREASLYLTFLNRARTSAVTLNGWDSMVRLPENVLKDLNWWLEKLQRNEPRCVTQPPSGGDVWTDASNWGWGALAKWSVKNDQHEVNIFGHWVNDWSSNRRELQAVSLAIQDLSNRTETNYIKSWLIHSDNSTTVYNLNRRACAPSLLFPMRQLFKMLNIRKITLQAIHVRGCLNDVADSLSRLNKSGDYELKTEVLELGLQTLGAQITCDLFASRRNHKHQKYCTLSLRDSQALARDAFSIPWSSLGLPLLHPPIPLIQQCINKVAHEQLKAVLVVPNWTGQWWSTSLKMITEKRVLLGEARQILIPGKSFSTNGYSLPPGEMAMHLLNASPGRNETRIQF